MNSTFQHKGKKIILPANVAVTQLNDKVISLAGRYFYGHETKDYIILQPEPYDTRSSTRMWAWVAGVATGTFLTQFLHWVFK